MKWPLVLSQATWLLLLLLFYRLSPPQMLQRWPSHKLGINMAPNSGHHRCAFSTTVNKSLWLRRGPAALMRSCVAATWMRSCRLHSCTEPMVTTRLPPAHCSPAAYYMASQTTNTAAAPTLTVLPSSALYRGENPKLRYFTAFALHLPHYCMWFTTRDQ